MAKGKYAARAAGHREDRLADEIAKLRAQLAEERAAHHADVQGLKTELTAMRSDIHGHAQKIADVAIEARGAELEQAMKDQGLSFDLIHSLEDQRDRLMFNACRYLSMRHGLEPLDALACVWTWFTDVDCFALPQGGSDVDWLVLGLPKNGWVGHQLRRQKPQWRKLIMKQNYALDHPEARALDSIDVDNDDRVHPEYRKRLRKHYQNVRYAGGLELVDSDGTVTEIS